MTTPYSPGIHALGELHTTRNQSLVAYDDFRPFVDTCIHELGLNKIGEVYHNFESGGFTAVVCLTESHISIHTWPEHGSATLDVFLSNYQQVNDGKARTFFEKCVTFFDAELRNYQEIRR